MRSVNTTYRTRGSSPAIIALTDALRAGPGSPQWRDAVNRLREQGGDQAGESHSE